ncbi:MAG: hypothetical protein ACO1OB_12830 [Archangium sp.]
MKKLLVFLILLVVLVIAAIPVLVNGKYLLKLVNFDPGIVSMDYTEAKWVPPFSVEVKNFELRIQDHGFRIRILADEASGSFMPFEMMRKRIAFTNLTARGVSVHVRLPEDSNGTPQKLLPDMSEFATPTPPPDPVFSVELTALKHVQVRDIWVDGFHYVGDIDVSGGFALVPKETLTLHPVDIAFDGGVIVMPSGAEAKMEPSTVKAHIEELPLTPPLEQKMLKLVNAEVNLAFHAPNLNFFNSVLLEDVPDVRIMYGAGNIAMNVAVDEGVVREGSEVIVAPRAIGVRVPHFDIVGKASIVVKATDKKAHATVSIPEFEVDSRADDGKVASGKNFRLTAVAGNTDLTAVRHVDVNLKLDNAEVPSLRFLDRYVPAGSGIIVVGGHGNANVEATLSTRTQKATGKLSIKARQIQLKNRSATVTGAAEIVGVLGSFDLRKNVVDLGGSNVKLTNVTVKTREKVYTNVTLSAVAPKVLFAPETDHPWEASLAVGVSNLQPLVGIVSANVEVPGIVVGLLNIPDVAASASLDVRKKEVRLMPMALTAKDLRLDAQVVLNEVRKDEMEPHGAALLRLGPLTAGMAIDGGIVTPIILGAPDWYKKQVENGVP